MSNPTVHDYVARTRQHLLAWHEDWGNYVKDAMSDEEAAAHQEILDEVNDLLEISAALMDTAPEPEDQEQTADGGTK